MIKLTGWRPVGVPGFGDEGDDLVDLSSESLTVLTSLDPCETVDTGSKFNFETERS